MRIKGRKLWGIILSVLLIVPLISINPVKAEIVSHKVFELSNQKQANVGDTIDVNLKVYPKEDLSSFQLSVNYDTAAFQYKDAEEGNSLGGMMAYNEANPGEIKIACASGKKLKENKNDEIFLTLQFVVRSTQKAVGNHDFKVTCKDAYNINDQDIQFNNEVQNSQISVDAPLKGISLDQKKIEINKGESQTLVASKIPEFTTNSDSIQWSSKDASIASVDQSGKVTAHKGGSTEITAKIGSFTSTCLVTVKVPLEKISIEPVNEAIDAGSQKQLVVSYLPLDTTVSKKIVWKSGDTSIATIDENGVVTALKRGTVKIEATMGDKKDSIDINVRQPLVKIKIDQDDFELVKNKEATLTVTEEPSVYDDQIDKKVWASSDEQVATVDQTGKVKALKEGHTVISITYTIGKRTVTASVTVTVKEIHVTEVKLDKTNVELLKGQETDLQASYLPLDTTDSTTTTWSTSNDKIITVDKNGHIKAIGGGKADITATIAGKKAVCHVQVNVPLQSISIESTANVMYIKETLALTVKYNPTDTTVDRKVQWKSSDSSIATVDENGLVTAIAKGKVDISATVLDKTSSVSITIQQPLEKIEIEEGNLTLIKNETKQLNVKENPTKHDDTITKKEWKSSDSQIAEVNQNGLVTAKKEGTVQIFATYYVGTKSYQTSIQVKVKEIHIEKVTLNKTKLSLNKGDTDSLTASYTPANTTDETTVKWTSSNTSIVKVDQNGHVEAVGGGSATITATIANKKAECIVSVRVPLTGISLSGNQEVLKGQTTSLTINKEPVDATETLSGIQYETSDDSIAKVDKNGKVTGIKEGNVDITVSGYVDDRYFEAKHAMTVKEIKLQSIEIEVESPKIVLYTTQQAQVKYNPYNTTDDKAVTWTSSDEDVATVDQNGNIKGLKPGKTKITVTSKFNTEFYDEVEIEVYEIPMESIQLDKTSLELTVGDSYQSQAKVLPANTTDSQKLTWKSSNEEIATVDQNGKIKALKKGEVIITVMAKDGQITETLKLKVINKKVQPTYTVEKNQVGLSVSKEQLSNVYQDIPADFKTIVDDGGKLTVILKSEVINNQELLTQLNNQLKQQEIMKDYQIGQWLDINIVAEIQSVEGNKQTELLTDLSKPLEIKIAIPQELLAKNREYAIVRIHEGKAEVLDTQLSSDQKYLMFKSDRFSEYAIIYRDIDNHKQQNKDENTVSTDDTTMIGMEIMGMIVSGLIVVLSYKKKKYL